MAQQGVGMDREQLCCSICLDLLKDPVTVPCGHSYCKTCIEGYWNRDDQRGRYSCPQCRQRFNPRPVLKKTSMLAEVVESLKTGLQAAPPAHYYAGPGDVACDVCTGRRLKAVKTCLQCLVSYCDTHLLPHYQSPAFKKHKLVNTSGELQENICSRHNKVYDLFCCTDQQCICSLCSVEEHKGHNVISVTAAWTERQTELHTSQQNIQQRIQKTWIDVMMFHQDVELITYYADKAVEDSDTIFTEFISSMERRQSEVRELIREQRKRYLSRVGELRTRMEQELTELRRRHAELEQLSLTEDHIRFLQHYTSSLSAISQSTHPVSIHTANLTHRYYEDVIVAVSNMRDRLDNILTVSRVNVSPPTPAEHKTRAEFLKYFRPITLNPRTAHQKLSLSKENKEVRVKYDHIHDFRRQSHFRFTSEWQVLSKEALSGRVYSEVKWTGNCVDIAVSDKVNECFGFNDKSWCLRCTGRDHSFRHGLSRHATRPSLPGRVSDTVGVYLDCREGILSFYSVSGDTMTLIHTVHPKFTHNLYFGLGLHSPAATAELCDLK